MTATDNNRWIEQLKREGLAAVKAMYQEWRQDFVRFASSYQASEADVLDAYQDAVIVFYENVMNGKLTQLKSSPKTYLFSIAKYTLFNKLKANNKLSTLDISQQEIPDIIAPADELNDRQERMYQALKLLGNSCRKLIQLFYFQRLSIQEIVQQTELKNENTVKAQKSRCIKTLRGKMA